MDHRQATILKQELINSVMPNSTWGVGDDLDLIFEPVGGYVSFTYPIFELCHRLGASANSLVSLGLLNYIERGTANSLANSCEGILTLDKPRTGILQGAMESEEAKYTTAKILSISDQKGFFRLMERAASTLTARRLTNITPRSAPNNHLV